MAVPDPFPGEWGSGPLKLAYAARPVEGLVSTRCILDHPGGSGRVEVMWQCLCRHGHVEAPDLAGHGRGSEDPAPYCQARGVRHVTKEAGPRRPQRDVKGLATLAGGTPVCMYRQYPIIFLDQLINYDGMPL